MSNQFIVGKLYKPAPGQNPYSCSKGDWSLTLIKQDDIFLVVGHASGGGPHQLLTCYILINETVCYMVYQPAVDFIRFVEVA